MSKTVTIVTPCFNEEDGIHDCWRTVRDIFRSELPDFKREHIFCDNASTDRTTDILRKIAKDDPSTKIIVNSRNFGILRNTFNGVLSSGGDATILFLPADLQDPPDLIPEFVRLWQSGYEVVYGIRAGRQEQFLMRSARKAYYWLLSHISNINYPPDVGDFQLVDRKVLDALKRFKDVQPFMRMMTFDSGFRSVGVSYTWRVRQHGRSRNKLSQLIDQGLLGLISYSSVPLRLAIFSGFVISASSFLYVFSLIVMRLIYGDYAPEGTLTIVAAIFFFGGVQLMFTGFLGEYIAAIFNQVRGRPIVIERERINFDGD